MNRLERNAREAALALAARGHDAKLIAPKRRAEEQFYILQFKNEAFQGSIDQCEALVRAVVEHTTGRANDLLQVLTPVMKALGTTETLFDEHENAVERLWEIFNHTYNCLLHELTSSTAALQVTGNYHRAGSGEVILLDGWNTPVAAGPDAEAA